MEKNALQGEPRREPTRAGPTVAIANVDPCVVYLDLSQGEALGFMACWARSSSSDVPKVGGKHQLKLSHVWVVIGTSLSVQAGKTSWHFLVSELEEVTIVSDSAGSPIDLSFCIQIEGKSVRGLRGEIKFIDRESDLSLARFVFSKMGSDHALAKRILEIAAPDWRSLQEAKAFLQEDQRYEAKLPVEPGEGELMYNCGEALFKAGDYKLATQTLQLCLKHPGVRYPALNLMGLSFMKRGMVDFAVKQFAMAASELTAMDEVKKELIYNLGLAYEASNRPGKALEQWKNIYGYDMSYRDVSKRVEDSYGGSGEQAA